MSPYERILALAEEMLRLMEERGLVMPLTPQRRKEVLDGTTALRTVLK